MSEQRQDGFYPYQPANGIEGEMFMEKFCYRCKHDDKFQKGETDLGCPLIRDSMIYHTGDKEYPEEWISDDACGLKSPRCTGFVMIGNLQ
jgi:hypothetical protein